MRRTTAIGAAAMLALALAPASALAQDDTSGDVTMTLTVPHPSHIHAGDCTTVGDVVAPLSDVGPVGNDAQGSASAIHVDVGSTTVDLALSDILATDHSIRVHQSAEDMGTFLACGAIGGHDVDGSLLVGLAAVGDSGYSGIARLTDNGDGTTDVLVAITQSGASASMDTDMGADDMSGDADNDMGGDTGSDG